MNKLFKDLSIRIKIMFTFIFIVLIFSFIGINQFNTLKRIEAQRITVDVISKSYFYFMEGKYLLSEDIRTVNEIYGSVKEEDIKTGLKQHKLTKDEIYENFDKVYELYTDYADNELLFEFTSKLKDSTEKFIDIYENNILVSFNQIVDYKEVLLNPVELEAKIKISFQENSLLNKNTSNLDSINKYDLVYEELLTSYKSELDRHKTFIEKNYKSIIYSLNKMESTSEDYILSTYEESRTLSENSIIQSIVIFLIGFGLSLILTVFISQMIIQPLKMLKNITYKLAKGELPEEKLQIFNDEIGEMNLAINSLLKGLKETSNFAYEIGKGNFEHKYTPLSEKDVLGNSLLDMRKSLQFAKNEEEKRKIEDLQRSWTTEGLAKFGEILRHHTENIKELSNDIIINMVKYLNANQGGIFILNDSNPEDIHLELLSAYAYNRKKYITKKIKIGDGLVGAVALEKYTIYMTEIPNEYIEIESGMGSANPRSILIVPLKIEEEILGVIEIASFNELQSHEINLVERIAESIASTLSTARINTRTAELLEQSKKQALEMHEQEEEMRQTIEQMQISQEDSIKNEEKLNKVLRELEINHKDLELKDRHLQVELEKLRRDNKENVQILTKKQKHSIDILETTLDGVIIFDENGNIEFFNNSAQKMWGYKNTEIIGRNITKIFKFDYKDNTSQSEFVEKEFDTLLKDNAKEYNLIRHDGGITPVFITVSKNELFEGIRYTIFVKDLSKLKEKEVEKTKMMEEIMAKEFKYIIRIEQLEETLQKLGNEIPVDTDISELLKWNESYSIDLSIIDKQHLKWIEIINKFFKFFREGKAAKKMDEIYKELIDYTEYHFGFEEKYLSDFKFEHFKKHKEGHDAFIRTIKSYYDQHKQGKVDVAYQLMIFLKKWVKNHIQEHDKAYVECFKNNGLS